MQIYLSPIIAAAEICRRSMWALLRLEWEQLHSVESDSKRRKSGGDVEMVGDGSTHSLLDDMRYGSDKPSPGGSPAVGELWAIALLTAAVGVIVAS